MSRQPTAKEREQALRFVNGPEPRSREQIVDQLAHVLASTRDEGRAEGELSARVRVLREHKAMLEGLRMDIDGRLRTVERDLSDATVRMPKL